MRLPLRWKQKLPNTVSALAFSSQCVLTFYHKNIITGLVLRDAQELLHPGSSEFDSERRPQPNGEDDCSSSYLNDFPAWLTFFNDRNLFHRLNASYWLMMAVSLMGRTDKAAAARLQKFVSDNWEKAVVNFVTLEISDALQGPNSGDIFLSQAYSSEDKVQQRAAGLILAATAAKDLDLAPLVSDETINDLYRLGKAIWGTSEWKSVRCWLHSELSKIMNETMRDERRRVRYLVDARASYDVETDEERTERNQEDQRKHSVSLDEFHAGRCSRASEEWLGHLVEELILNR